MEIKFFCGGSDTPFVFYASAEEATEIVQQMNAGKPISMIGEDCVVHFNPLRIDAIQVQED